MDDCVRAPQSRIAMVAKTVNDAVMIPASAVLKSAEGAATVMIVSQDRAHQVAVETGIRQGDRVQITKGLGGNETVIVSGAYGLPDNTQVKLAPAQSEKPGADSKEKD